MTLIISTGLELGGVLLVGITIVHLLIARLRIRSLQQASGGRADELLEIIEEAERRHVTMPAIWEVCLILTGVTLNISGVCLRLIHEIIAHFP
jgi:hypothetical protein